MVGGKGGGDGEMIKLQFYWWTKWGNERPIAKKKRNLASE